VKSNKGGKKRLSLFVVLFLVLQVMGVFSAVHAILVTRTPQGAIAWSVSLVAMPVIAVPAYWFLGRSKFQGYVDARRDNSLILSDERKRIDRAFAHYVVTTPRHYPEYQAIRSLAQSPFLKGNHTQLLVDGKATYDSLHEGIEAARDYVLFQFYIIRDDETGNGFKRQLIRKAGEGVKVYVLYDELGSAGLRDSWLDDFRRAGVHIARFNTRQGKRNRFQVNFRNHRKILVVDGRSAWVGGLNIGDEYLGRHPELSPWRDTHMRIDGPAALVAQSLFMSDWHWAAGKLPEGLSWTPNPAGPDHDPAYNREVLVLGSGPADELETASLFFTNALNVARRRIWIATPYFIPDEATMVALRLALLKKLDVRIITPELNDNWFVRHASNVYLSELSRLGAKIYFYQQGFMHQKVTLLDDSVAMIGTVNFNNRSFRLNFEVTGAVADIDFAAEVEQMLRNDIARSVELTDYDLEKQSWWERFKAHGAVLMAPVL